MGMYLVGLFVGLPCLIALIYLWLTPPGRRWMRMNGLLWAVKYIRAHSVPAHTGTDPLWGPITHSRACLTPSEAGPFFFVFTLIFSPFYLHISIFFRTFAIVKEITIATIGCGSEKPEQAQLAFLLVASIFGLDYYVKLITRKINGKHQTQ